VYYLAAFLIVSLLILLHELGHFAAARAARIPISRVSFGLGPKVWSFQRGKTEYRISAIPLGGYVLPELEEGGRSFLALSPGTRALFAIGGPLANFAVAYVLFAVDAIYTGGFSLKAVLVQPAVGIVFATISIVQALPGLFDDPAAMSGFVGVVSQGGELIATDGLFALRLAIIMSINLAILNLLPIPPLDGGKLILCGLEGLFRGAGRLHIPLSLAGLAFLLLFVGYTTFLDISRIVFGLFA
jgi:regulator of sigma E protease